MSFKKVFDKEFDGGYKLKKSNPEIYMDLFITNYILDLNLKYNEKLQLRKEYSCKIKRLSKDYFIKKLSDKYLSKKLSAVDYIKKLNLEYWEERRNLENSLKEDIINAMKEEYSFDYDISCLIYSIVDKCCCGNFNAILISQEYCDLLKKIFDKYNVIEKDSLDYWTERYGIREMLINDSIKTMREVYSFNEDICTIIYNEVNSRHCEYNKDTIARKVEEYCYLIDRILYQYNLVRK